MLTAIVTIIVILVSGILYGRITGLYMALFAGVVGQSAQLLWVRHRSRWAMRQVEARDGNQEPDFITGGSGSSAQ
jgi:predicted lipid-binding transport protein (Tim44 family)